MPNPAQDPLTSLAAARNGSNSALGELLETYRNYLLLIAEQELDPRLRAKGGASDLVQETFLEAQRDFSNFQGHSEEELLAWLRQLLHNNLANFARRYRDTEKRQVAREVPLASGSSGLGRDRLAANAPSPPEQLIADEECRCVLEALERLPEEYRTALLLRCREGHSFEEIGRRLERTRNAAQKLWVRALERLREELGEA
jgi:RNA polymerase sigma-70 factor (ECF subfamily)